MALNRGDENILKKISIILLVLIILTSCNETKDAGSNDYDENDYANQIAELEDTIRELQNKTDDLQQHIDNNSTTEPDYVLKKELSSAISNVNDYFQRNQDHAFTERMEMWTVILNVSRSISEFYKNAWVEDNLDYEPKGKMKVIEWLMELNFTIILLTQIIIV